MRRLMFVLLVCLFASPAYAEWWEAKTDHFIVYSESTRDDAKGFAERLERFDQALRALQKLPTDAPKSDFERLTVYRFGDTDDIGKLAGAPGVAGFYIPRMGGSVAFTPARADRRASSIIRRDKRTELDPMSVLLHEYAHHFMYQHFPAAYPSWYVEGFAETAATIDLMDDGSFHVGNPPQYRSDALFSPMMNISVQSMLTSNHKPDLLDVYGHYTVGWLLNHYLTFSGERPGQLTNYLRLINQGADRADAARTAFGDLNELNSDVLRYKNSGRLGGADVKPNSYTPPHVTLRRLGDGEAEIMRSVMRSQRGVNRETAPDVASDARAVARRHAASFPVQLELAEAELDAENLAAADAAVDRALNLNSESVQARILKGRVALERGKKDKKFLQNARAAFARAHELDPENPAPLYYNYLSYYEQSAPIPESAIIGLEQAFRMAMFDSQLRLVLARQLLGEGKGELSKTILQPLALNPHESKSAKALDEVIALIDANKASEAHAMLTAKMKEWEEKARNGESARRSSAMLRG